MIGSETGLPLNQDCSRFTRSGQTANKSLPS